MRYQKIVLCITVMLAPCVASSESYLAKDIGKSFPADAKIEVLSMNDSGDVVFQEDDAEEVYFYNQEAETISLLNHELYGDPLSVALSDDGKIALQLTEGEESGSFVLITDYNGNELERYEPAALSTDNLTVKSLGKVFFLPDNQPGALAYDDGETIFTTTYILFPSLSDPETAISSYGFSIAYSGSDFDGNLHVTNCLVSGHSSCAIYRIVNGSTRKLVGPKGSSGAVLSGVNGVGSYFAYPYPYGVRHYFRKKGEGDYAVYRVTLKKPSRYFRKAEISNVTISDFNSKNTLLNINVRFRARKLRRHPAIGSAHNPNIRRRVKLLSRMTDGVPTSCKLSEALKINESGQILVAALCSESNEKIKKVMLLSPQ